MKCDLYDHINNKLGQLGFEHPEELLYKRLVTQSLPPQVMMINGRQFTQPGQQIETTIKIELVEGNEVINPDGSTIPFVIVNVTKKTSDSPENGMGFGVYYDEPQEFDKIIKELFGV